MRRWGAGLLPVSGLEEDVLDSKRDSFQGGEPPGPVRDPVLSKQAEGPLQALSNHLMGSPARADDAVPRSEPCEGQLEVALGHAYGIQGVGDPGDGKGFGAESVSQGHEAGHGIGEIAQVEGVVFSGAKGFGKGDLKARLNPGDGLRVRDQLLHPAHEGLHVMEIGAEELVGVKAAVGEEGSKEPLVGHGPAHAIGPVAKLLEGVKRTKSA